MPMKKPKIYYGQKLWMQKQKLTCRRVSPVIPFNFLCIAKFAISLEAMEANTTC